MFLFVSALAMASERVEIPLSRGIIEFNSGHYAEALERFDEVLSADPDNISALYYRGVTYGRLGQWQEAIDDLRKVVAAKPDFQRARLELGTALLRQRAYEEAIPLLEQAAREPDLAAEANYALGRAQLDAQEPGAARDSFGRVTGRDDLRAPARFYQGVASYRLRDWDSAHDAFADVESSAPNSELGRQAAAYLWLLRPYEAHASIAFEYDSNVQLAPSNAEFKSALGISNQQDGRAVLRFGGSYAVWRTARAQLTLGYDFSQSLQFQLTDFNLQAHQPYIDLAFDADVVQLGFLTSYDYYLLQTASFFQQPIVLPWVTIPEGNLGRSEIFYRFRYRDFYAAPFVGVRNDFNYSAGASQFVYLGSTERYLWVAYRFDVDDPQTTAGLPYAYDGNEIEGGSGWAFPADVFGEASYTYRNERYSSQSLGRRDNESLITALLHKQLSPHWEARLAFFADINESNQPVYEYQRYVVSLGLETRF
jgi:Tfp pilus assembly protein PilF